MPDLPEVFRKYKNSRIAVYGLGAETEKILPELERRFQVAGLLDSYRENGTMYGQSIISVQKAVEEKVQLILVVARPGSCRAIAKRIRGLCMEHGIALMDIRGRDLCSFQRAVYDFKGVQGISIAQLFQAVESMEAVSFDLFDTLIMRQVLFPTDIFDLVDRCLQTKGIFIKDFSEKRLESEKRLSRTSAPTLTDIYICMAETYHIQDISPQELAELEWETDYNCLIPREEMCEVVRRIDRAGKKIYITSDTWYNRKQVELLLKKCRISCCRDLFLSCEHGTGKTQQLFSCLKEQVPAESCIHIGDDEVADVEYARKNGVAACRIYSGMDLLEMVGYLGLADRLEGMESRIKTGLFVSKLFNSPFQFESEDRRICVKNPSDIGYLFLAPLISDFVFWFYGEIRKKQIPNVWFGARDGFLIQKLYDDLAGESASVYFLISRTAAVRAGVQSADDIRYVDSMKFSGSIQEQLKERFGIVMDGGNQLEDYTEEILKRAAENRIHYKRYIDRLDIKEGKTAFFDFVAKGTSQMFLERLTEKHMTGFYFLQLEKEYMQDKKLDIVSFYEPEETADSIIYDNYYILETILTSPDPSLMEFDEHGRPRYGVESRSEKDIACIRQVQEGIWNYFKAYRKLCRDIEPEIDRRLDELFLILIHHLSIQESDFLALVVEDPFFNRMTDISDLI